MKIYEIPKILSWGRYGKIPCSEQYTFTSGATYDDLDAAFFTGWLAGWLAGALAGWLAGWGPYMTNI